MKYPRHSRRGTAVGKGRKGQTPRSIPHMDKPYGVARRFRRAFQALMSDMDERIAFQGTDAHHYLPSTHEGSSRAYREIALQTVTIRFTHHRTIRF